MLFLLLPIRFLDVEPEEDENLPGCPFHEKNNALCFWCTVASVDTRVVDTLESLRRSLARVLEDVTGELTSLFDGHVTPGSTDQPGSGESEAAPMSENVENGSAARSVDQEATERERPGVETPERRRSDPGGDLRQKLLEVELLAARLDDRLSYYQSRLDTEKSRRRRLAASNAAMSDTLFLADRYIRALHEKLTYVENNPGIDRKYWEVEDRLNRAMRAYEAAVQRFPDPVDDPEEDPYGGS